MEAALPKPASKRGPGAKVRWAGGPARAWRASVRARATALRRPPPPCHPSTAPTSPPLSLPIPQAARKPRPDPDAPRRASDRLASLEPRYFGDFDRPERLGGVLRVPAERLRLEADEEWADVVARRRCDRHEHGRGVKAEGQGGVGRGGRGGRGGAGHARRPAELTPPVPIIRNADPAPTHVPRIPTLQRGTWVHLRRPRRRDLPFLPPKEAVWRAQLPPVRRPQPRRAVRRQVRVQSLCRADRPLLPGLPRRAVRRLLG